MVSLTLGWAWQEYAAHFDEALSERGLRGLHPPHPRLLRQHSWVSQSSDLSASTAATASHVGPHHPPDRRVGHPYAHSGDRTRGDRTWDGEAAGGGSRAARHVDTHGGHHHHHHHHHHPRSPNLTVEPPSPSSTASTDLTAHLAGSPYDKRPLRKHGRRHSDLEVAVASDAPKGEPSPGRVPSPRAGSASASWWGRLMKSKEADGAAAAAPTPPLSPLQPGTSQNARGDAESSLGDAKSSLGDS